jgi:hypothetical protein
MQLVIQMARDMGVKTVNLVRERATPEAWEATVKELKDLGADIVATDNQAKEAMSESPRVRAGSVRAWKMDGWSSRDVACAAGFRFRAPTPATPPPNTHTHTLYNSTLFRCPSRFRSEAAGLPEPLLGLNCIGGESASTVAKLLGNGGVHVTYGGMSLQPVNAPVPLLIFKDISFRGFWLSGR